MSQHRLRGGYTVIIIRFINWCRTWLYALPRVDDKTVLAWRIPPEFRQNNRRA